MLGRLTLDASLPVADVFGFLKLPLSPHAGTTLCDWLTDTLAPGHGEGDSVEWHGAHFEVSSIHEGRIANVKVALASAGRR